MRCGWPMLTFLGRLPKNILSLSHELVGEASGPNSFIPNWFSFWSGTIGCRDGASFEHHGLFGAWLKLESISDVCVRLCSSLQSIYF